MKIQRGLILVLFLTFAVIQNGITAEHAADTSAYHELNEQVIASIDRGVGMAEGTTSRRRAICQSSGDNGSRTHRFFTTSSEKVLGGRTSVYPKGTSAVDWNCNSRTAQSMISRCNPHFRITILPSR